jgi:hypothetical protein
VYKFIFYLGGRYSLIPIKSYIILDFRETTKVKKTYPNTLHILPSSDFSIFTVLDGTSNFEIPVRKIYPSLLASKNSSRITKQECQALKYEMSKRNEDVICGISNENSGVNNNNNNHEIISEIEKKQNHKELIENLGILINFLTNQEKYLRNSGSNNEADNIQKQRERAANDLSRILYEKIAQGFKISGDSSSEDYYHSIIDNGNQ